MRKLVLAALVVFALTTSAPAALVLHVGDATVAPGGTATIDVWLEETAGDNFSIDGWSLGLKMLPRSTVTVQGHAISSGAHPSLFNDNTTFSDVPGVPTGYDTTYDRFVNDDGPSTAVDNATRSGLFSVTYQAAPNALPGVFSLSIDPALTEFSVLAVTHSYEIVNGSITVVPEPSAFALALFALPLIVRRHR